MMEKDMTVVDPDPEASVEGFGDYGFAFNRNTCLQCMACTAGYNDCSEPSAQYYHIEAQPPTFTEKSNTDPVEPRENSTVVYDADTEKYGDKIVSARTHTHTKKKYNMGHTVTHASHNIAYT